MRNVLKQSGQIFIFHPLAFLMKIEPDQSHHAIVNILMSLIEILPQPLLGTLLVHQVYHRTVLETL